MRDLHFAYLVKWKTQSKIVYPRQKVESMPISFTRSIFPRSHSPNSLILL